MTTISIGADQRFNSGISRSNNKGAGFANTMAVVASAVGNTVTESLAYSGNPAAATISAVATNSTVGGFGVAGYAGGGYSGGGYSPLSTGGSYYSGGSPSFLGAAPAAGGISGGISGGGGPGGNVENILAETATSQAYLLGIQAELGAQQSTFTAISNALNTKYGMERSVIQNFRA